VEVNVVALVVAVIGAGGLGAFFREIVAGVTKVVGGMSARESKRKVDLVQQRDVAIEREARAWKLVDAEAAKRRAVQEYAARLRVQLILGGIEPEPEPVQEKTLTKSQLNELRDQEESP
jgi:hypothetical protein